MQGDFSRRTFDAANHFAAVLHQQGRVQLEADLNEQAEILLYQVRTALADLIGPAAAPKAAAGFDIESVVKDGKIVDLRVSPGRMYVDGLLVENDTGIPMKSNTWVGYWDQPDGYLDPDEPDDRIPDGPILVYLRVWEQLVTSLQQPRIREIALGDAGPDTAVRSKVVWQLATLAPGKVPVPGDPLADLLERLSDLHPRPGLLAARAKRPQETVTDPCLQSPEAQFRGPENQLYRVEIHSGGPSWPKNSEATADRTAVRGATFKWSRENASVVLPVISVSGASVRLTTVGRDGKLGLAEGDWVELTDDARAARIADDRSRTVAAAAGPLRQVRSIDPASLTVILSGDGDGDECGIRPELHPVLRRWDHRGPALYDGTKQALAADHALPVVEGVWIALEDGVEVRFTSPSGNQKYHGTYRPGDYWMIPARTVTGDVEWPRGSEGPAARAPEGIRYHYAPLATVVPGQNPTSHRKLFDHIVP